MAKLGKSLTELAMEIERRAAAKKDYVAPVTKLEMAPDASLVIGNGTKVAEGPLNAVAHGQMAAYTGIYKPYYDRMLAEAPELLAANVNQWLPAVTKSAARSAVLVPDRRMVRMLDGNVRALLSDGYKPMENEELAEAILPVLLEADLMFLACEITDRKLYLKVVDKRIERDMPTGAKMGEGHVIFDTLSPALTISNSEVGFGRLSIDYGVYTKQCTNLASFGSVFKRTHIGGRAEDSAEVLAMLSDETRKIGDQAIWAKVRDVVKGALDAARFMASVEKLGQASERKIVDDPVEVVERLGKKFGVNEGERKSILRCLIEGASLTQYGLSAAITRASADFADFDRATEFEAMGGQIIELPSSQWKELAEVA